MASPRLKAFLLKLDAEMRKDPDKSYREHTNNKETHIFYFDSKEIRRVMNTLLNSKRGDDAPTNLAHAEQSGINMSDFRNTFNTELNRLTAAVKKRFTNAAAKEGSGVKIDTRTKTSIVATVTQEEGGSKNIYKSITNLYKTELNTFYTNIVAALGATPIRKSERRGYVDADRAGAVFNLEHVGSNVAHQINDAIHDSLTKQGMPGKNFTKLNKKDRAALEEIKTELEVIKNLKKGTVHVSLGSALENVTQAGKVEIGIRAALKNALEKLDIPNLKGSDSLAGATRKKVVKKIMDPFKKIKGARVTTEDIKIDDNKKPSKSNKKAKNNVKTNNVASIGRKRRLKQFSAKDTNQQSMFTVMVMINQKLPETVKKNMKAPRLQNQTGKFASSVRITEATRTARGFPSFGYTYEKNPYQVYESGVGREPWEDGHRDPRQLIDASIREIAANLALGRFYTRRV